MANHVTSVLEIREAGILLKASGGHVVRVLGALKEIPLPSGSGALEDLRLADASVYERFLSGELAPPAPDPNAPPDASLVTGFVITANGQLEFLKRGA